MTTQWGSGRSTTTTGALASRTQSYGSPAALQATPNKQAKAAIALFGTGAGISNWKGDRIYDAWQSAGHPQKPTTSKVLSWIEETHTGGSTAGATTAGQGNATILPGINTNTNTTQKNPQPKCVIGFPAARLGLGSFCILNSEQATRVLGGLLVVAGGLGMSLGLILLAAYGLEGTVASRIGKSLAGSVPGGNRVTAGAPAKPSGDEDDSLFESLPAATKARITAENRTQAAEESRRQPKPYESPFTTADASTPTQRPASARRRQPQRERRPRATSHR